MTSNSWSPYIHNNVKTPVILKKFKVLGVLIMVGVSRFELEASWSRTKRDTKLRHTPLLRPYELYTTIDIKSSIFLNILIGAYNKIIICTDFITNY